MNNPLLLTKYCNGRATETPNQAYKEFFGYSKESYIEIYFIYKFAAFKKELDKNLCLTNRIKNRPGHLISEVKGPLTNHDLAQNSNSTPYQRKN